MSCYVLQVCIWYILIHYVYVMYMLCVCCLYVTWCWRFSAVKSPGKQSPRRLLSARSGEDTGAELSAGRAQRQFLRARNRRSEERPERHWSDERNRPVTDLSQTCHSPRMGSQAQCGKWPFNHLGICWFIWSFLELTSDDFSWRLKAIECSST